MTWNLELPGKPASLRMTRNLESRGNPANREPNRVAQAVAEQVNTSTGSGLADWGDGYGLEPGNLFALNCHIADADPRHKPARKATP